jgi:hypothetical protein
MGKKLKLLSRTANYKLILVDAAFSLHNLNFIDRQEVYKAAAQL